MAQSEMQLEDIVNDVLNNSMLNKIDVELEETNSAQDYKLEGDVDNEESEDNRENNNDTSQKHRNNSDVENDNIAIENRSDDFYPLRGKISSLGRASKLYVWAAKCLLETEYFQECSGRTSIRPFCVDEDETVEKLGKHASYQEAYFSEDIVEETIDIGNVEEKIQRQNDPDQHYLCREVMHWMRFKDN